MLEALRMDMLEAASRPAMEPDNTVEPPALFMNNELMIFLQETACFSMTLCNWLLTQWFISATHSHKEIQEEDSLLGLLQEAHGIGRSRILSGVVQPPTGIVLHPVRSVTVAQQEVVFFLAPQKKCVT